MPSHGFDVTVFAAMVEASPDVVIIVDHDGVVRFASSAMSQVLGHDPADLIGHPYDVLVPPDAGEQHRAHHGTYMERPTARPMGRGPSLRARHKAGYDIPVEIALVPLPGTPPYVAASIRDVSASRLAVERLAATNELLTLALGGADREQLVRSAVVLAGRHLGATICWLAEIEDTEMSFVVSAADGPGADELLDRRVHLTSERPEFDDPAIARRLDLGPTIAAPIASGPTSLGMLALARPAGGRAFDPIEREALQDFGDAVAVTLELVDARSDVDDLRHVAERDRIARDLHDTVIQHLFAISLRLEAVFAVADGIVRERMEETVDAIDTVIRDIRTTIFNLQHHASHVGPQRLITEVVEDAAVTLGFGPTLMFEGPLDTELPEVVARSAVAVTREALSNVARHASATNAEVMARLDETGSFLLTVTDNGVGPPETPLHGFGLSNLRSRAAELGGTFELKARPGGGAIAEWIVPVAIDLAPQHER